MDLQVDWEPGIGDPGFMGWFTVFAYFATAVLCGLACRAVREGIPEPERGRQPEVWKWVTVFLVALGINKQLDLQSLFTALARALLRKTDLMPVHRTLQFDFIVALIACAALFLVVSAWRVRRRRREYWLLLLGITFTTTFIVVRASSFHHVDVLLGSRVLGAKLNWVFELTGIALIAAAAWTRRTYARRVRAAA